MLSKEFVVLFTTVFATILGIGIVVPLIPVYAESMGADGLWIGVMFSAFPLARTLLMPLAGRLSDKWGRKGFIMLGLSLYAAVSLAYIAAKDIYQLTAVRFVNGVASAMVIPLAMAYIGDIAPHGEEGRYMGVFTMSLFLGMGAGPFIGGLLHDAFGLPAAFYAMCFLSLAALINVALFLPAHLANKRAPVNTPVSAPLLELLKLDVFKGLLVFRAINAMGRGGMMAFLPLFGASLGLSAGQVGILIGANILVTAALMGRFGRLADRYSRPALVIAGSLITVAALFAIPFSHNFFSLLAVNSIMGIGGAVSVPSATAIAVNAGDRLGMGFSMGVFNMAMSIGMISAPLLSGIVMDNLGIDYVFVVASILSFAGTGIFYYYIRRKDACTP